MVITTTTRQKVAGKAADSICAFIARPVGILVGVEGVVIADLRVDGARTINSAPVVVGYGRTTGAQSCHVIGGVVCVGVIRAALIVAHIVPFEIGGIRAAIRTRALVI